MLLGKLGKSWQDMGGPCFSDGKSVVFLFLALLLLFGGGWTELGLGNIKAPETHLLLVVLALVK